MKGGFYVRIKIQEITGLKHPFMESTLDSTLDPGLKTGFSS